MRRKLSALTISMLLCASLPAAAQLSAPSRRVANLEQWLRALVHHAPGDVDEPLLAFGEWPAADWQTLLADSQVFAMLSRKPSQDVFVLPVSGGGRPIQPIYNKAELRRLRLVGCAIGGSTDKICPKDFSGLGSDLGELARRAAAARAGGDAHYVLRVAALLHLDLIAWGGTQDVAPTTATGAPARLWIDVTDGRGEGLRQGGIQWLIAYGVIDPILSEAVARGAPAAERDPWTRDWFVATTLWMHQQAQFDQSHLERGLKYFPDDPDLRFLSACQHEIDAGPTMQNAMKSVVLPPIASFWIQSEKRELRDAASDLRRALAARPGWREAHLRLGRVLAQLGDSRDASPHLRTALAAADKTLQYYAALFLGSIEESDGHPSEAAELYEHALSLYPSSQSPHIALSGLAHRRGDRASALRALQPVLQRDGSDAPEPDPWWNYLTEQARNVYPWIEAIRRPYRLERWR